MPLPQRPRHVVESVGPAVSEISRLITLCSSGLDLSDIKATFAAELETLKIEQLAVLEELRTLLRKAAREQRAAARSVCDALDLSHLRAASAGLSGVVDSVTRLLIEEVLYSRERVFLLRQAVSVLRQQREAADVGLAAPAPPPASRSSGSSAGGADAAAGPATGALAALGLSAAALLPPRRRTKLGDAGRAVLLSWLQAHVRDPYPSDAEKGALAAQTGTSVEYVSTWFINSRARRLPKMVHRAGGGGHGGGGRDGDDDTSDDDYA